jgi:hypothetical protein
MSSPGTRSSVSATTASLSTSGARGDVEPTVGLAVQLRALGAEGCDALVATGMTPAGVWR